jgi:hypothetical protein
MCKSQEALEIFKHPVAFRNSPQNSCKPLQINALDSSPGLETTRPAGVLRPLWEFGEPLPQCFPQPRGD